MSAPTRPDPPQRMYIPIPTNGVALLKQQIGQRTIDAYVIETAWAESGYIRGTNKEMSAGQRCDIRDYTYEQEHFWLRPANKCRALVKYVPVSQHDFASAPLLNRGQPLPLGTFYSSCCLAMFITRGGSDLASILSKGPSETLNGRYKSSGPAEQEFYLSLTRCRRPSRLPGIRTCIMLMATLALSIISPSFCFYPEVPRISPKGYLPNGLKVPRCRVSQLLAAREAAGKPYLLPADRHDEPEMVRCLELEKAFEADFGFPFSSEDGWDPHFKRMTFHALVAETLCHRFNNDASKIAVEFSKPLIFNVQNPYLDGDARQLNLEMELRRSKLMYEGADAVDSLPLAINTQFPFRLRLPCTACWGPAGYYDDSRSKIRYITKLVSATRQPQVQDIYINQEVFSSAARQFDASMFAVAYSATATNIRNAFGPHLPQGQMVELAVLHVLRLSHLDVHPIQLIYRDVGRIFQYLPVGPPVQIRFGGFNRCTRSDAAAIEISRRTVHIQNTYSADITFFRISSAKLAAKGGAQFRAVDSDTKPKTPTSPRKKRGSNWAEVPPTALGKNHESRMSAQNEDATERTKGRLSEITSQTRTGEKESMLVFSGMHPTLKLCAYDLRRVSTRDRILKRLRSAVFFCLDSNQAKAACDGEKTPGFIIHSHRQTCRLSPCFSENSKQSVENAWLMVSSIYGRNAVPTSDREPVQFGHSWDPSLQKQGRILLNATKKGSKEIQRDGRRLALDFASAPLLKRGPPLALGTFNPPEITAWKTLGFVTRSGLRRPSQGMVALWRWSLKELSIRQPSGDTEAMFREIIPGPNAADYPNKHCPNEYPHEIEVDLGDTVSFNIASTRMICNGSQDRHLLLDDVPPARCATQQGPLRPVDEIRRLLKLRDGFRPLNNKLHHLWDLIMKTRDALAAISGEQFPPLPPKTAEITSELINDIQDTLESLAPHHVPREPEVLTSVGKGKEKESTSAWPARSTTPLFDEDVGVKYNEDGLIPDLNALETVLPTGGKLLHIVIYYEWRTLPLHVRCWTADPTSFIVAAYDFPGICPAAELLVYRVADEQYCAATDPLDVAGGIVVCRRSDILETGCVWLNRWTQRARDQAAASSAVLGPSSTRSEATAGPSGIATTGPSRIATAGPSRISTAAKYAVEGIDLPTESNKKRKLVAQTTPESAAPSSKRQRVEDVISATDKRRARVQKIQAHGYPDQPPLSLTTSDLDYSSDVEILSPTIPNPDYSSDVEILSPMATDLDDSSDVEII
ncbi:hypothetical protein DFH06DRAFT_1119600 [Mycena polygramma]|nr:hypothetical protein DFH06DRAFT_1119600 [Mycena polygramma]